MFKFDLLENEKLVEMYRQTEWILLKPMVVVSLLIYFPWYFFLKYGLAADFRRWLLLWTILVFSYAVYNYLLWLLNVNLLTDKRVICVRYFSLFRRKISECFLDQLANLSVSTTGMISSMFSYGNVEMQAVNSNEPLVLRNIREPNKIKDHIWKLKTQPPKEIKTKPQAVVKSVEKPSFVIHQAQKKKIV